MHTSNQVGRLYMHGVLLWFRILANKSKISTSCLGEIVC